MRVKTTEYDFFSDAVDWFFNGFIALLLLLGWSLRAISAQSDAYSFLLDLYLTLGALAAGLLLAQNVWRLRFSNFPFANAGSRWRKYLAFPLRRVIYAGVALLVASGFLEVVFSGALTKFWGATVALAPTADEGLAGFFATLNRICGFLLAASLIIYGAVALTSGVARSASTALVSETTVMTPSLPPPIEPPAPLSPVLLRIGQDLARRIRIFGWIGFWSDFFLAFLTAPLLAFGAVGKSLSPSHAWIGEPLHWGFIGLLLLFVSLFIDFYSTLAARRLDARPRDFLAGGQETAFWFLGASSLVGLVGSIVSFVGVGLSIALLIAKTVSQPPGIAITDPAKIVRALDVFILMGNFNLLLAHFLGVSGSVWLSMGALKARHKFVAAR
jgi:cytochrome b561